MKGSERSPLVALDDDDDRWIEDEVAVILHEDESVVANRLDQQFQVKPVEAVTELTSVGPYQVFGGDFNLNLCAHTPNVQGRQRVPPCIDI